MRLTKGSGFTLLELLIVVVIIGILVTIVLPQFGKIIDRSRETEALNILGSILTAEYAYFQDPNEGNGTFTADETKLTFALPTMKYWVKEKIDDTTDITKVTVILKDNGSHGHATAGSHKVSGVIDTTGARSITYTRP